MYILIFLLVSATIPQGWPMFRCDQQRTGYTSGVSNFSNVKKLWAFLVQDSEGDLFYTSPVSADFNSDGKNDVLLGACGGIYPTAELYRGYDTLSIWSSDVTAYGPYFSTPALMDVDGDTIPEVFLYESDFYTFARFRAIKGTNGTQLWANTNVKYSYYCAPLVIEGTPGTVIAGDTAGTLFSLNATTGTENWSYSVGKHIQPPSLGDVDNDGNQELVVVAGTSLFVFELSGSPPIWTFNIGDSATTPMLVNLDADPALEIVLYAYNTGYIKAFDYNNSTPFINQFVGPFVPDFSNATDTDFWPPSPAGGDITGDGIPEIFIHNGNALYCLNGTNGDSIWANPQTHLFGSPVLADLDNDGYLEVVVTGAPGDNNYRSKVECYEHTGTEKWQWMEPIFKGFPDPILNEACLSDLNGDSLLEITTIDYSCWALALVCDPGAVEELNINQPVSVINTIFTDKIELAGSNMGYVEYSLYDISGRVIQTGNVTLDKKGTIYLHKIKCHRCYLPGIYFLQLKLRDTIATGATCKTFKLLKLL